MKKLLTSTVLAAALAVALAPAAFADVKIVNKMCVTDPAFAAAANCYMSERRISMQPGAVIYHSPVNRVIKANPGIENMLDKDGFLPPYHMIATVPIAAES
jgi:hypothetical protein